MCWGVAVESHQQVFCRVGEFQPVRMQRQIAQGLRGAILHISHYRMTYMAKLGTNLVLSPRLQLDSQQRHVLSVHFVLPDLDKWEVL